MLLIDIITFLLATLILIWPICILLLPIVVVVILIVRGKKMVKEIYPGRDAIMESAQPADHEALAYEAENQEDSVYEELPFQQLFKIGKDMCLLVDHVEMCPDETAFIRVADDQGYTPLYKRKVRRDEKANRFIVFNGTNYYLDKDKTKPVVAQK